MSILKSRNKLISRITRTTLLVIVVLISLLSLSVARAGVLDVGAGATDRAEVVPGAIQVIDLNNSANASGILNSIRVWANTNVTGLRIGTFYNTVGANYTCRDSATIGNVVSGSEQTFVVDSVGNPLEIKVQAGDFLGVWWDTGNIDYTSFGNAGVAFMYIENMDTGDNAVYDTGLVTSALSIYGTGITVPTVVTKSATGVTVSKEGVTGGLFSGNLTNMGGYATNNVSFQYGLTTAYGANTTPVEVNAIGVFTASIPATLTPGATYHYRAMAHDAEGYGYGSDDNITFTTPTVSTLTALDVSMGGGTSASLRGSISSMGVASDTYLWFRWGYDGSFGYSTANQTASAIGTYTSALTGFDPERTVYYQAAVTNGAVTSYGTTQSLVMPASGILASYRLINGVVLVAYISLVIVGIVVVGRQSTVFALLFMAVAIYVGEAFIVAIQEAIRNMW